jgi:hypothetical protein
MGLHFINKALGIFYIACLIMVLCPIPEAAMGQQLFADVTATMGINESGASYGQAVSWCDMDLDGDLDLAFSYTHGSSFRFYRNDGNQFTNITTASGLSGLFAPILVWGEVTGDAYPDLIVDDRLYRNNQDGTFTNITAGSGLVGFTASTGDFDHDGNLDLVAFNSSLNILWGDGLGHFTAQPLGGSSFMTAVCFDYDTDGDMDIFAGSYSGSNNALYRNNGARSFDNTTTQAGLDCTLPTYAATAGDYNNDGWPDLYIGNHLGQLSTADNRLYRNNGNGTFNNVTETSGAIGQPSSRTCTFVDYNNDGWLDIMVNDHYHGNHIYRNNGDESFSEVAASLGLTGGFGDYFGMGWGDYNNDGATDLFVAGHFHIYRLYQNQNCPDHWLKFRLQGAPANRFGLGARIDLWTAQAHTTRWSTAGEGENDFHSMEVEFGLGSAVSADSVQIIWPGGQVQHLEDIAADQIISIQQEEALSPVDELPKTTKNIQLGNHPNPFNPRTTVVFELPETGWVEIEIFDASGRQVATLGHGVFSAGAHALNWDGITRNNLPAPSGIYFCRLNSEFGHGEHRMVLVR